MRFIFDCEDEICLPMAYHLVDDIKAYAEKLKAIDVEDGVDLSDKKATIKVAFEKAMVKAPKETSALLAKLWVLEEGESAPNVFKTMTAFFASEVAVDFFTSALPSLLQISKGISHQ